MIDIRDFYAISLRRNKGFMIDITELIKLLEMKKGKSQKNPNLQCLRSVPVTGSSNDIKNGGTNLYLFIKKLAGTKPLLYVTIIASC